MAQNVTIAGAAYKSVPAIDLPKTGGGTARFYDTQGNKALTPGLTAQNSVDVKSYATVSVAAVTKELLAKLDSDFVAENVRKDVDLFGLVGTLESGGGSGGETWVLNETVDCSTEISEDPIEISFTSDGQTFQGIYVGDDSVCYFDDDGMTWEKYVDEVWDTKYCRKITFASAPAGELLTWLTSNGVKQAPDTAVEDKMSVTVYSDGALTLTPHVPYDAIKQVNLTFDLTRYLKITTAPSAPSSPKENEIWIKASPYDWNGAYVFGADKPSSPMGTTAWFPLEEGQGIIRKACVYSSKNADWVAADAYIYTGGKWVQIATATYYLINGTDKCLAVTGGWNGVRYYWSSSLPGGVPTVSWADGGVSITASSTAAGSLLVTENAIDVTSYSEMVIECESASDQVMCQLSTGTGDKFKAGQAASVTLKAGTNTMDLSALTGKYYVGIQPRAQKKTKITQILLR